MAATEQTEHLLIETLHDLGLVDASTAKLPEVLVFDIACALVGAREALERALSIVAEVQLETRAVGA